MELDAAVLDRLARTAPRLVLLLGASDTGKTTLIEQVLAAWEPGEPIAVVDCDVGQSHLGPPTTVGWGLVEEPFAGWRKMPVRGIAFTGAVSPEGNLETFLQATVRMVQAARQASARLVVDTTGLVNGELGTTVKCRKVALIKPDLILAIQRERELEELLAAFPRELPVERLTASPQCVRRSLAERAAYRDTRFVRYFANSAKHVLSFDRLTLAGVGPEWPAGRVTLSLEALLDRIVGLRNVEGEDLALGLLRGVDLSQRTCAILTPLRDHAAVKTLAVGSIRWPG